jgi:hypothetical protein
MENVERLKEELECIKEELDVCRKTYHTLYVKTKKVKSRMVLFLFTGFTLGVGLCILLYELMLLVKWFDCTPF